MTTDPTTTGTICRWHNQDKAIDPAMKDGICEACKTERLNKFLQSLYTIKSSYGHYEVQNRRGRVMYWGLTKQDAQNWIDEKIAQRRQAA
jgi:hypothetical protein